MTDIVTVDASGVSGHLFETGETKEQNGKRQDKAGAATVATTVAATASASGTKYGDAVDASTAAVSMLL